MTKKLKLFTPLKQVKAFNSYPETVDAFYRFDRGINKDNLFGMNEDYYFKNLGVKGGHNGLDIMCYRGAAIMASHSGWVLEEYDEAKDINAGFGVVLVSNDEYEWLDGSKSHCKSIYWHNERNLVKAGDKVNTGDIIALSDSTGFSTGDHLHFMIKQCDEKGNTLNWNNGRAGAIDPYPYIQYWDLNMPEEILIDDELLELLYEFGFSRKPDTDYWKGKSVRQFLKDAISQPEHKHYVATWKFGNLIIQFFKKVAPK